MASAIGDYALLGDCHSAALVGRDGSIDWWCAPRFDSRSAFARLLDPGAGHWSIRPSEPYAVERVYLEDTMVLQSTFSTTGGVVRLTDAMVLGPGRGHEIGLRAPHALIRRVEGLVGRVPLEIDLQPRLEYGLVVPRFLPVPGGHRSTGGPDTLLLSGDSELEPCDGGAKATVTLASGRSLAFALQHEQGMSADGGEAIDVRAALEDTISAWRSWAANHAYDGAHAEHVRRSALVLQALTYQPTGAIVAAPTASLPEVVGGDWNWDYRYAWLRDASLTLKALWVAACPDEATRYFDWMAAAASSGSERADVQIMFGVEGERDLTERQLPHLAGYRDSQPVRVGNDAWRQRQLDVYGEVLEAAWTLRERLAPLSDGTAAFLRALVNAAASTWQETDAGIWEGREGERHYLSSKVMCWVALDRGVRLAELIGADEEVVERWARERTAVQETVLRDGWSEEVGAYTGALRSDNLDASVLLMAITGFLPADDPRMGRTIDTIERELAQDGHVRRWTGAVEGGFVICSFWLANALAMAGELERAEKIFAAVIARMNDVGLLAEEIDPSSGDLIGNFPQAFSHVGLINAAWSIHQARQRQERQ
ncbi:MAG: glycoside hydrolase family 15 protein [Solirubrobacteraceae bacterium]